MQTVAAEVLTFAQVCFIEVSPNPQAPASLFETFHWYNCWAALPPKKVAAVFVPLIAKEQLILPIFATTIANVTGQFSIKSGPALIPVEVLDSGLVLIGNLTGICGDDICNIDETCENCQADCGGCPICGDDICNGVETCITCPGDCGECEEENGTGEEICGDGVCGVYENCLCEDCEGEQDGCESIEICQNGVCVVTVPPSVSNCADYCDYIGYRNGVCRQNSAQCTRNGETWEGGGDSYCIAGSVGDFCCCIP